MDRARRRRDTRVRVHVGRGPRVTLLPPDTYEPLSTPVYGRAMSKSSGGSLALRTTQQPFRRIGALFANILERASERLSPTVVGSRVPLKIRYGKSQTTHLSRTRHSRYSAGAHFRAPLAPRA